MFSAEAQRAAKLTRRSSGLAENRRDRRHALCASLRDEGGEGELIYRSLACALARRWQLRMTGAGGTSAGTKIVRSRREKYR